MRMKCKWVNIILASIMILGVMIPQKVYAIDRIDESRDVSLTVQCTENEELIADVGFELYKVAEMTGFGELSVCPAFEKYVNTLEGFEEEDWIDLVFTLDAYISADEVEPLDTGVTDENGTLKFPNIQEQLSAGLYLVRGNPYVYGNKRYEIEPTLICLPNRDIDDEWIYDVVIKPKKGEVTDVTDIEVVKVWKDNNSSERPKSIEVELLRDGEVFETAILNKESNWRMRWEDLDANHEWKVVEKNVPKGYKVSINKEKGVYVITNTNTPNTPPGPPPSLPQTGMLWWPVPILACIGTLFFMIGWNKRQRSGE